MKRITAIALLAIASFAMADNSFAQDRALRANVPFDFTVGSKLFPSGTYTIKSDSSQLITIQNRDKGVSAFSTVIQDGKKSGNGGKLVFHKYGDQYFLSEILCDSADMNLQIPASKLEQKVRLQEARLNTATQTLVATTR
jgi:hypothetical protein